MDNHDTEREQRTDDILKIHTLGRFQVSYGDKKLFEETGRYQKIGDLLMYFITYRNKPAASEVIIETLWPDSEYANPKNVLKNLVYRLKQSLEEIEVPNPKSYITSTYGGYSWNNKARFWVDADEFEKLIAQAQDTLKYDPVLAINKYREALSYYMGHYYPEGLECQWIIPKRHYYRSLFVKSASELFATQKEYHFFDQMAEDCEKVLSIESFDEKMHLYYMEALLEEGKITQALNYYEYITALNYNELGSKPSPAMQRIYKDIRARADKEMYEIEDVQKLINDNEYHRKAIICEPDTFRLLCRLEKSRAERSGHPVYLGLITLTTAETRQGTKPSFKQQQEQLKDVLQSTLRKMDVISAFNDDQLALLLPGLDYKQSEIVIKRIENAYYNSDNNSDGVVLLSSIHPVLSE